MLKLDWVIGSILIIFVALMIKNEQKSIIGFMNLKIVFFVILLSLASVGAMFAQPGNPDDPDCWPPEDCVPIDGGIGFLIAAAVAYGGKKTFEFKKKSN